MTIQKFIKYTQVDITGKQLSSEQELKLNVLDESGNYLIHKDFVRHLNAKRQRTAGTNEDRVLRKFYPHGQPDCSNAWRK